MGVRAAFVMCVVLSLARADTARPQSTLQQDDGVTTLVYAIEQASRAGDATALQSLVRPGAQSGRIADFVQTLTSPRPSAVTVKERYRAALGGGQARLLLEILTVSGHEARVTSWRVDIAPAAAAATWT